MRAAVAVSIDGLNTIDGKRSKPSKGAKWIIEPYSSITIDGWQTSISSLRRFVFTSQRRSYASWKEKRDRKNYVKNLGVIGIAWFWNSSELAEALRPSYSCIEDESRVDKCESAEGSGRRAMKSRAPGAPAKRKAGTGMGRRQKNRVTRVRFDYDAGMYRSADVLKIFYEFGCSEPEPQPFDEDNSCGFAPEMR